MNIMQAVGGRVKFLGYMRRAAPKNPALTPGKIYEVQKYPYIANYVWVRNDRDVVTCYHIKSFEFLDVVIA